MHGLPRVTTSLIAVCLVVALASGFGGSIEFLKPLFISVYDGAGLPEIRSGQVWRLITPIFIHFGILHLAFNMLWLWDLGSGIERVMGSAYLGLVVAVTGVLPNVAQYAWDGPAFGGMSGVVYGLLGYIWMQGRFNPYFGLYLRRPIVVMMLVWYVLCWTGIFGPIANMAHTVGLALGVAWGFVDASRKVYG